MQSILIAEPSEEFRIELAKELRKKYRIYCCTHGEEGLQLQKEHHPDGLIINLRLHGTDGLHFLENMDEPRPKAIVTLAAVYPPYVEQVLKDLGVIYPFLIPCTIHSVTHRIDDILRRRGLFVPPDKQEIVAEQLRKLKAPCWSGYQMLRVGVPLFAQDRNQRMTKDLYPAIAILCNCNNWEQVERAIRDLVHYIWAHRDDEVWKEYFPDTSCCPANRKFISRLSEFLDM